MSVCKDYQQTTSVATSGESVKQEDHHGPISLTGIMLYIALLTEMQFLKVMVNSTMTFALRVIFW